MLPPGRLATTCVASSVLIRRFGRDPPSDSGTSDAPQRLLQCEDLGSDDDDKCQVSTKLPDDGQRAAELGVRAIVGDPVATPRQEQMGAMPHRQAQVFNIGDIDPPHDADMRPAPMTALSEEQSGAHPIMRALPPRAYDTLRPASKPPHVEDALRHRATATRPFPDFRQQHASSGLRL